MKKTIEPIKATAALKAIKLIVKGDHSFLPLFKGVEKSTEITGETALRTQSHADMFSTIAGNLKKQFGVALPEDKRFRHVQEVVDHLVEASKPAEKAPKAPKAEKAPKGEKAEKSTFKPKKGDQFRLQDCKDEEDNGTRVTFVRTNKEEADSFIVEDKKGNLYDAGEENLKPIRSRKAE